MLVLGPTWGIRKVLGVYFLLPVLAPLAAFGPRSAGAYVLSGLFVAAYVALCVVLGRRKITIDDDALTRHGTFSVRRVPWREVSHYTYATGISKLTFWDNSNLFDWLGDLLIRRVTRRFRGRFVIHLHSGEPFAVDSEHYHLEPALEELTGRLHAVLGPRGDRFDPLTLADDAVLVNAGRGAGTRVPLLALHHVVVDHYLRFFRDDSGDLADAVLAVPLAELRNGLLLIQRLAERSLTLEVDADASLPPSLVRALAEARARHQAMPRAAIASS
jgi:hypothetical protein